MHRSLFKRPGIIPPSSSRTPTNTTTSERTLSYEENKWKQCFDARDLLEHDGNTFCIYSTSAPIVSKDDPAFPLLVLLHGGGHTALSWAMVARRIKSKCMVIAPDLRGHGRTKTTQDDDWSIDTLSMDLLCIINNLYHKRAPGSPVFVVGHSLGGAIAVHACKSRSITNLAGIAVIDVVEGTAMEALKGMKGYLSSRPSSFASVEEAIAWSLDSDTIRNEESACISVPSLLKEEDGELRWIADLVASEPHWEGWFSGLTDGFLDVPAAKLLVLAGTDRLDTGLTRAQMMGKYQLVLLPSCGHAIQEDDPESMSTTLLRFVERNTRFFTPAS